MENKIWENCNRGPRPPRHLLLKLTRTNCVLWCFNSRDDPQNYLPPPISPHLHFLDVRACTRGLHGSGVIERMTSHCFLPWHLRALFLNCTYITLAFSPPSNSCFFSPHNIYSFFSSHRFVTTSNQAKTRSHIGGLKRPFDERLAPPPGSQFDQISHNDWEIGDCWHSGGENFETFMVSLY